MYLKLRLSLAKKFGIYILLIALSCMGVASVLLYKNTEKSLIQATNNAAESKLRSLTNIASYYLLHYESELLEKLEQDVRAEPNVAYIQVLDADGKAFFKRQEKPQSESTKQCDCATRFARHTKASAQACLGALSVRRKQSLKTFGGIFRSVVVNKGAALSCC